MTRRLLIEQLAKARALGDRAATTMLLARIRAEERRNTAAALSARPGGLAGRVGNREPWSELEKLYRFGR
jgi:hypothetical protein